MLDNHGYVVISDDKSHVGKSIGQVDKNVTHKLEEDRVFKAIIAFDYQGICFPDAIIKSCPSSVSLEAVAISI